MDDIKKIGLVAFTETRIYKISSLRVVPNATLGDEMGGLYF